MRNICLFFNLIIVVNFFLVIIAKAVEDEKTIKQTTDKTETVISTSGVDFKIGADHEHKIEINPYTLRDDDNVDLQLFWLGEKSETQLLLTTTEMHFFISHFTKPSTLYQSTDFGLTFDNIQSKIKDTTIRKNFGIMKSPINKNRLILISYEKKGIFSEFMKMFGAGKVRKSTILITKDAAHSFKEVELPFIPRADVPFEFHPLKEDWIIALEEQKTVLTFGSLSKTVYGQAWITKDFGETWRKMMSGRIVESAKWGATNMEDDIYLSTHQHGESIWDRFESTSRRTLWKSQDGGHFFDEIIEHMYNFGVQGGFVFASVNFTEKVNGRKLDKRILHVSTDHGKTFHAALIPGITNDMFYSVVEMYKGSMFLHVDEIGDTGKGTLYVSGADGLTYMKSLDSHFYSNNGLTDFYRVESMKGVYITQQLNRDKTLGTMITFNRGVTWQRLNISDDHCKGMKNIKSCSLHIHNSFSQIKHYHYQTPISSENAPGIILVHGNAGDGLAGTGTGVWLSRNGGYNWKKIAMGPHHYAIGDNGNLLVMVPKYNTTGMTLLYSLNQGRNWYRLNYDRYQSNITLQGLATEPHSKERIFSLWGQRKGSERESGNETTAAWTTFTVNFEKLITKKCSDDDLELWYPHSDNNKNGCLLGEKITHKIPKATAMCYLGRDFNATVKVESCQCTEDDLECDYGYERSKESKECKRNDKIKPIEICEKGEEMIEKFSKGYRRIPGDVCLSKDSTKDIVRKIDEKRKCNKREKEENIFGVVNQEKEEKVEEKEELEREKEEALAKKAAAAKKKKSKWPLVLLSLVLVCGVIGFGYWYMKKQRGKNNVHQVLYNASSADGIEVFDGDNQVEDRSTFDPRPKSHREYHDETDAEDDVLLLP